MSEKFRETEKAIAYIAGGLQKEHPDATAEVILVQKSRPMTETCRVQDIVPVLERLCRGFRAVSVHYHPRNPYGFVAEVRSHGESVGDLSSTQKRERPRVVVLLTEVAGHATGVGDAPDYRATVDDGV